MPKVDFTEVKKVPFASILSFYRIPFRKRSDTELVLDCPLSSHSESAHKQTLAISTVKQKGFCHSEKCRAASNKPKGFDPIDFVQMYRNLPNPLAAAKEIMEMFALNGTTAVPLTPSKQNPPLNFELKHLDPNHEYIRSRGITAETAKEFGVGYHKGAGSMSNRICFPLHENGNLIGYAGRTTLDVTPENPKWKLPKDIVRSFLFGIERCDPSKPLILSESPWATLWFAQHNFQCAALLGSSMTEQQESLLAPYPVITLALDDDSAGRAAATKLVERLKATHRVTKAFLKG